MISILLFRKSSWIQILTVDFSEMMQNSEIQDGAQDDCTLISGTNFTGPLKDRGQCMQCLGQLWQVSVHIYYAVEWYTTLSHNRACICPLKRDDAHAAMIVASVACMMHFIPAVKYYVIFSRHWVGGGRSPQRLPGSATDAVNTSSYETCIFKVSLHCLGNWISKNEELNMFTQVRMKL